MFLEERIMLLEKRLSRLEAMQGLPNMEPWGNHELDRLLHAVCKTYFIHPDRLLGRSKSGPVVKARQVLMWLARMLMETSATNIGKYLRRHHGTVLYAVRRVAGLRDTEPAYRAETDALLIQFTAKRD